MRSMIRFAMLPMAAVFFASCAGAADTPPAPAQTILDQAIQKAKAENKAVFVHLSASW